MSVIRGHAKLKLEKDGFAVQQLSGFILSISLYILSSNRMNSTDGRFRARATLKARDQLIVENYGSFLVQ